MSGKKRKRKDPAPLPARPAPTAAEGTEPAAADVPPSAVAADVPAATGTPRPGFFRRLSPVGRVVSALVAGISFVTGIIAVVPIFTRDATNFDSLRLEASPFAGSLEYAVPSTSDFAGFPDGPAGTCSADQQAWLDGNGARITTTYLIDMQNVASDGPMLALNAFKGEGEGETTADPVSVKVVCDPTGARNDGLQAARLLVSDPTQVAYFDSSAFGQTQEGVPDSPVAWNLAPGETGQILMTLFPTAPFAGDVHLTALSGSDKRDFVAVQDVALPGLVRGGVSFLKVDGGLACLTIDADALVPCEISDILG